MDEIVSDGMLIEVNGLDMSRLLSEDVEKALDRLLKSSTAGLNGFNSSI